MPETFFSGIGGWIDDDLAFVRPWGFDVSDVAVPIEVWYGATDVLVPAAHGRWLAEHIRGAQVHVDRSGGHLSDPDQSLANLAALVRSASA